MVCTDMPDDAVMSRSALVVDGPSAGRLVDPNPEEATL
jgi:hypothetical protein